MKISPNFHRSEFACQCNCGFDTVDIALVEMLEIVRGRYDIPVTITSGCRCPEHNEAIGGSEKSQHMLGKAADFKIEGVEPERIASFIYRHTGGLNYGIGTYNGWVHLDSRDNATQWDKR